MESEKNKGIVALIIVLVLIILGLSGYIVYDKFIQKKEPDKVVVEKDCNCPKCEECEKCEECDNKPSNCNCPVVSSYLGEKVTSIKKIELTKENQTIKIGNSTFKMKKDDENKLYIDDEKVTSLEYSDGYEPDFIYVTDRFVMFTNVGQFKESIGYAISEKGEVTINRNDSQMDNFKIVGGYLHATGGGLIESGQNIDWKDVNLIIKFIDNTLIVTESK